MPQRIHMRRMTTADVPALAQFLASDPLWQRYSISEARARRVLEAGLHRGEELHVATMDGQLAGLIWFLLRGTFGRSGYIQLIGVLPPYRRQKVGTRLMALAEQAIGQETDSVFLLTSHFNTRAQAFYQHLGYQQVGAIPDYVVQGITELIFYKRLW